MQKILLKKTDNKDYDYILVDNNKLNLEKKDTFYLEDLLFSIEEGCEKSLNIHINGDNYNILVPAYESYDIIIEKIESKNVICKKKYVEDVVKCLEENLGL